MPSGGEGLPSPVRRLARDRLRSLVLVVVTALAAAGGMSAGRLAEEYGSASEMGGGTLDPLPTVDALWKVSPEARRAWAAHAAALVVTCEEVTVDLAVRP